MISIERKIELYRTRGWCPVPLAHHPEEVRRVIRMIGFRPMMKECFRNSQQFIISCEMRGLLPGLEYREGLIQSIIPIEHAWLWLDGRDLDLTLDRRNFTYKILSSTKYKVSEIRAHLIKSRNYSPVGTQNPWEAFKNASMSR
jgi:hypothetical protein